MVAGYEAPTHESKPGSLTRQKIFAMSGGYRLNEVFLPEGVRRRIVIPGAQLYGQ